MFFWCMFYYQKCHLTSLEFDMLVVWPTLNSHDEVSSHVNKEVQREGPAVMKINDTAHSYLQRHAGSIFLSPPK